MKGSVLRQRWQSLDRDRRNTLLFWAAAAAAVIAMALYLSIVCNAMLYTDDTVSLPLLAEYLRTIGWGGFVKMRLGNFWQTLRHTRGRFYPFSGLWSCLYLPLYSSIASYRWVIITFTVLTDIALGTLLYRVTGSRRLGLACFALVPLMLCLWLDPSLNAMYSFQALPQRALLAALLAAHCMVSWAHTRRWRWAVLGAVCTFVACGTYELGYIYLLAWGFVALLLHDRFWKSVCTGLPLLAGELTALAFYAAGIFNGRASAAGNAVVAAVTAAPAAPVDTDSILVTTLQQMWGAFPHTQMLAAGAPFPAAWSAGDVLTSLVLAAVMSGALYACRVRLTKKQYICLFAAGFVMVLGPSVLIALTGKYRTNGWVTWHSCYIPATVEAFGAALMLLLPLLALLQWAKGKKPKAAAAAAVALALAMAVGGVYQRASTRASHPASEAYNYELAAAAAHAGLAAPAAGQGPVICDFDYWGNEPGGPQRVFDRIAEQKVEACLLNRWLGETHEPADTLYRMGVYGGYGGYTTCWFARAQDEELTLFTDLRVYVDAARIPSTAVLKYYRLEPDGTQTVQEVPLAELKKSVTTEKGNYIVEVPDRNVLVPKVMIWDG